MNKVSFVGRLTKDPEARGSEDNQVVSFSLAVKRRFKREGDPEADFPSFVAFGKQGQTILQFCKKGRLVGVIGRYQMKRYTPEGGRETTFHEFVVEDFEFLDSNGSGSGNTTAQVPSATPPIRPPAPVPPDVSGLNIPF